MKQGRLITINFGTFGILCQLIMIQIKVGLIYLFKDCKLQYQRKVMNREQQVIQLCRESLNGAAKVFNPQLSKIFSDPQENRFVRNIILDPYVAIMYCIHVKNHLKIIGNALTSLEQSFGQNEEASDFNTFKAVQVASQTDFFKYLKTITKTNNYNVHSDENDASENTTKKMKKMSQPTKGSNFSKLWYESVIFINMLIYSKKCEVLLNPSCQKEKMDCLNRLRMQLLAKLSINIQIELGKDQMTFDKFEAHLKILVCFDKSNEQKSIKEIITIIKEFMSFIQMQQELTQAKKFARLFGKSMMRMLMEYLRKLLFQLSYSKDLIRQMFSTINQFMGLINVLRGKHTFIKVEKPDGINRMERTSEGSYQGDVFAYCHFAFVGHAAKYIDLVQDFRNDQSLIECLDILDKITLVSHFIYYDKHIDRQTCQSFTDNLNTLMKKVITKWTEFHNSNENNQNNNSQYYVQCQIINIFGNIFNNTLLSHQHEQLLISSIHFCREIIQIVPIKVSLGERSIFATMFYYLRDALQACDTLEDSKQVVTELRSLTECFFETCFYQEYDNIHVQFLEDIDNSQLFFDPIVEFIQKIYITNKKKLVPKNYFTIMKEYIQKLSKEDRKRMTILEMLMIESVKHIQSFRNGDFYQQKCSLLFRLFQLYSNSKQLPFLMLLDAISDQIIKDETTQMGDQSIYLWQYIDRQTNYTLNSMMELLSTQLVNYVIQGNSLYLAKYAIRLLSRLCIRLMKVQENIHDKTRKLINQHFKPVISFISNFDLTVLDSPESYKQRSKILELMCLVGIKKIKDVYNIYQNIKQNACKHEEASILKYFIDASGLLSYRGIERMEHVILQLIFNELKANMTALDVFTIESLQNPTTFQICTSFLLHVMNKLERFNKLKKQDGLIADFELIFMNKLDIFCEVYDDQNYLRIHQLWTAFSKLERITMKFPTIPKVIYGDKAVCDAIDWILSHLQRLESFQQVKTLYSNVFERKHLRRQQMVKEELLQDIADFTKFPIYLFFLAEETVLSEESVFFDYEAVIERQIIKLYNNYKQLKSNIDFFMDDPEQQAGYDDFVSFIQMAKPATYREALNNLIKASHIFYEVSTQGSITFANFKDQLFMPKMKTIVENSNT